MLCPSVGPIGGLLGGGLLGGGLLGGGLLGGGLLGGGLLGTEHFIKVPYALSLSRSLPKVLAAEANELASYWR